MERQKSGALICLGILLCAGFPTAMADQSEDPFKELIPLIDTLSHKNNAVKIAETIKIFLETATSIALKTVEKSESSISTKKLQNFKEDLNEKILSCIEDLYKPIDTD